MAMGEIYYTPMFDHDKNNQRVFRTLKLDISTGPWLLLVPRTLIPFETVAGIGKKKEYAGTNEQCYTYGTDALSTRPVVRGLSLTPNIAISY